MQKFFNANSVAIIGASSKKGKIGHEVLRSLLSSKLKIFAVNPKEDKILGVKTNKSISDLEKVDLAVLILSAKEVPNAIEELGKKGINRVVIISGGFKELGGENEEYERKTVENAKKYGVRIIGPNCIGILNGKTKLDTFFQARENMLRPKEGNISFSTQSGTFGCSFLEWAALEEIGISKFVSYGNKCDIDEVDMLNYLREDEETEVIAFYIEGLSKGKEFLKLAKEVSKKKPIVVLKGGKTKEGVIAVKSHTGSLAGDDAVFIGAMRQSGIIVVEDLEELFDVCKILSLQPLPRGNRIGISTNGAGPCVIAIDFLEENNLKLANLEEKSIESLKKQLPPFCVFSNPIDITGSADANLYRISLNILAEDENVDIIMPFFVWQDSPIANTDKEIHENLKKIQKYGKTTVVNCSGGTYTFKQIKKMQKNKIPCIPTGSRIIKALGKVWWYVKWRSLI